MRLSPWQSVNRTKYQNVYLAPYFFQFHYFRWQIFEGNIWSLSLSWYIWPLESWTIKAIIRFIVQWVSESYFGFSFFRALTHVIFLTIDQIDGETWCDRLADRDRDRDGDGDGDGDGKLKPWHKGLMTDNQRVTWTAFTIVAMFGLDTFSKISCY